MTSDQLQHLHHAAKIAGVDIRDPGLPQTRDIVANGVRLHLLEWGPALAPTIVLLHGGSLTAHTWDLTCASLSPEYHCLAVDLRGHGDSEWPPDSDYRLTVMAKDIVELIAQECPTPPVLIGMSLGGLTAIQLAGGTDTALAGLVIVDVGPEVRFEGARSILAFTATDQEMPAVEDFVEKAMRFNPGRRPELLRRSLLHNLRPLPNGHWTWKWDPRRMKNADYEAMARDHAALWDIVANIETPALVVRGGRSPVFTAEDAERLTSALPTATSVVVEDAGHTVQGDNAKGFLDVLRPFLSVVRPA
jgi:pimeloyl-ACP methyl ester carboxylesterase